MELTERDILRLRKAMASVGTSAFFPAYRNILRARLALATFLVFRFDPGKSPVLLAAWFVPSRLPATAVSAYIENAFPFDPFFQFSALPDTGGLYRLAEIAPDRFFSSEYYLEYYRKAGLCDEAGLLVPLASGGRVHLSISRSDQMGAFRRREISCLKRFAPVLLELLTNTPGPSAHVKAVIFQPRRSPCPT